MNSFRAHQREHKAYSSLRILLGLWLIAVAMVLLAFRSAPPDPPPVQHLVAVLDTSGPSNEIPLSVTSFGDTTNAEVVLRRGDATQVKEDTTSTFHPDSSRSNDTSRVEAVDSTARVENFRNQRHDPVYADIFPRQFSPFYLKASPISVHREVILDSTGTIVTVRESVLDKDVKIPITMPIEKYIQRRSEYEQWRSWSKLAGEYRPAEKEEGLGGVFGKITNIDIPVPANPLLSIFGPPRINLKISGAVDIRAAFRSQKSDLPTISGFDQVRNEPDFNQEVQINLNGTIGDKLNILADWNTQRVFEYENQLKIKYTGYEDEIVQSVEAGNVSLSTPSTFVGSSQALFGIKAKFQTGPLVLTTLLSQKKGQTRELTVTGGAPRQTKAQKAWEYSVNHFFLDTLYRKFFEPLKSTISIEGNLTPEILSKQVKDIEVWVSQPPGQQYDASVRTAVADIDLPGLPAGARYDSTLRNREGGGVPGRIVVGPFKRLAGSEFVVHRYEGYVTINTSLQDQQAVAAAYRIEGPTSLSPDDIFFGEFEGNAPSPPSRIVLKLIKPSNLLSTDRPAWDMMLKNVYSLGGRDLKKEGFELKVTRVTNSAEAADEQIFGKNLLEILGLDRFDETNAPTPDNKFDYLGGLTIDVSRAEVIFPSLEPFRAKIRNFFSTLLVPPADSSDYIFSEVYDTTKSAASQSGTRDRYVINTTFQAAQTTRYNLGFNLVDGSVRVLLNGAPLNPNVDYSVDYIIGEVVIRNPLALTPGANVQIKYEQNDLFQLAAKTLIGARGELSAFPNTQLGFTVMNLNQQTLSDKVRLGEEPTSNTIFGVDGSTSFNITPLTAALDALPFYQTREKSTLRVSGEAAYMVPDPNTKKSPIPSDRGDAVAYIDDFEGARRTIPLGVSYATWKPASPPVDTLLVSRDSLHSTDSKAKLEWYNPLPSDVFVGQIWPNRSVRRGEDRVTVLNMDFYPTRRGMYNYSLNTDTTMLLAPQRNWNGLMKYLSTSGSNLLDQNIGFLEIWMRVDGIDISDIRRGRLFVDLGLISEDVIPNAVLNSEDLVLGPIANGTLQPGEDIGLDMLTSAQEQAEFAPLVLRYPELAGDPGGDDYRFTTGSQDFSRINGPEANQFSPEGSFPNTEDINGNFQLDNVNSYLQYEVPLDTAFIDSVGTQRTNTFVVGGGVNRWYQFRIPLLNPTRIKSLASRNPQDILQNLQYVRLYLSGFTQDLRLRIADINLVGNQWQEFTKNDSVLKISVVNIEDNPSYTPPPGVIRERDRTQPDQPVFANEQSLALILKNLPVDSLRQAVKNYAVRPLDVFNYRGMRMFVHGDPTFVYIDTSDYDAAIFLRFGSDTANFYEYREPIRPGWDGNDIEVNFADLASIKALRQVRGDSINLLSPPLPVEGRPGAEYRVRGNPALTSIRSFWVGIINASRRRQPPGIPRPLTGEVWINELRLVGVDDKPGFAYRFDSQLKLADLGDVTFNYSRIDPQFHGLEQRFGSRVTNTNWGIGVSLGFEKFLPQSWQGTSVPFTYSHAENLSAPKYLPNTDVQVDEAANRAASGAQAEAIRTSSQTLRVTDSYAVPNLRIGLPTEKWYIRDTFNKLTLSFNYTTSRERNPVIEQRVSWMWNGRLSYAVTLPPDYYVMPFRNIFSGVFLLDEFKDWKLYYAPTNFSAGLGVSRSQTRERVRGVAAERPVGRSFTASRSFGFGYKLTEGGLTNITGDYGLNIESNLVHLETDALGQQRPFSEIVASLFFKDRFINFGNDARYGQRFSANSRPKIPTLFDLNKYLDLTLGYSVNYSWQNNFQRGDLDKSAGFDNAITVSTNIRLKSLTDPWFAGIDQSASVPRPPSDSPRRRPKIIEESPKDSTAQDTTRVREPEKEPEQAAGGTPLESLKKIFKYLVKIPFLEYENVSLSFTQTNRVANSGVVGGPGFLNFWGRIPFIQQQVLEYGPTRLYQLGIISDPSGRLRLASRSSFPFFGFDTERGLRAANASLIDQYGQTNRITMRTNRALWEGASLDLNWSVGWTFNKNSTILTDSLGVPNPGAVTTSGSVDRSYFSIPPVLFFKVFKSNLEDVSRKYSEARGNPGDGRSDDAKLAEAFEGGLEALPFFKKIFGQFVPRLNYTFRWDGLERIPAITNFVDRLSLEHAYASSFTRQWQGDPDGGERTVAERVVYSFAPLVGINVTMKELLKGNVTANVRYNTSTSYDLNIPARNIFETFSQEIALSLNYARRGFEFLLFGVSLSNDIEFGMTYSRTKNSRRRYEVNTLETNLDGTPQEGSTRTVMEPRIRYVLSSRVTASIFYRYTRVSPDEGGSTIPGTTTNEAGLDIHIAIQ